jgi:hypothetical protein
VRVLLRALGTLRRYRQMRVASRGLPAYWTLCVESTVVLKVKSSRQRMQMTRNGRRRASDRGDGLLGRETMAGPRQEPQIRPFLFSQAFEHQSAVTSLIAVNWFDSFERSGCLLR